MAKFKVKRAVEHDGQRFEPGDDIELGSKHADRLLKSGAIEEQAPAPSGKGKKGE